MTPKPLISRRRKRELRRAIGGALMRVLGPILLRALSKTWRIDELGPEELDAGGRFAGPRCGSIVALWHGRMLLGVERLRGPDRAVLVSPSGDGDISVNMLRAFGYRVVRGSSSRGGASAVRELLAELRSGSVVFITPDGPRGPRHSMNPGVAWIARTTGFPVVAMGMVTNRAWRLSSWDAFTIPKPFARVAIVFGAPIQVPRECTEHELVAASESIRARLIDCERRGLAHVGASEDW